MRIAVSCAMLTVLNPLVFLCSVSVGLANDASTVTRNDVTCTDQQCPEQPAKRVDDVVSLLQLPSEHHGHKDRLATGAKPQLHHVSSQRHHKVLGLSQSAGKTVLQMMWLSTGDIIGIVAGALGFVIILSASLLGCRVMIDSGSPERRPDVKEQMKGKADAQAPVKKGQAKDSESGASSLTPPGGDVTAPTGEAASEKSSACESDDGSNGEDIKKVVFAFVCYFPAQVLIFVSWFGGFFVQQILLFPFRMCGGKPLRVALDVFSPIMACTTFMFVSLNHGEKCLGRIIPESAKSFDELLERHSAMKRKNIRRNQRAAVKEFEKHKLQVEMCPFGTWEITAEIKDLIWHQCTRHAERAHGYADITNFRQPVSPVIMYIGEIVFLWMFPCDIQLFRSPEGQLVALNTRVHVGNMYFNPNYACLEDWSQLGIYPWSHWHMMCEAMRIRASAVNLMPSVRVAKKAMGCRHLTLAQSFGAVCSSTQEPRTDMVEEEAGKATANVKEARKQGEGGKRAQRKKAALEAAQAGGEQAAEPAAAAKPKPAPKPKSQPAPEKSIEQQSPAPAGEEQPGKKKQKQPKQAKDPAAEEQKPKSKPKKEPKPAKKAAVESSVPAKSEQPVEQQSAASKPLEAAPEQVAKASEVKQGTEQPPEQTPLTQDALKASELDMTVMMKPSELDQTVMLQASDLDTTVMTKISELDTTVDSLGCQEPCSDTPEVVKSIKMSDEPKAFEDQVDDRKGHDSSAEPDAEP